MAIDIRTIMLCNLLISAFFCIAYCVYWAGQKTYSGFGFWMLATFFTCIGFGSLLMRDATPTGMSVLATNGVFVLSAVLRLDAALRFMQDKKLNRFIYVAPFLIAAASAFFYFGLDRIEIRNLILSTTLFIFILAVSWQLVRHAPAGHKLLYYFGASFIAARGTALIIRALQWLFQARMDVFSAESYQPLYFLVIMIGEIGIGVIFMMMNNQRAEAHLSNANAALFDSERRYRSLSDAAFEGIVISEGGTILEANNTLANMFGYRSEELQGKKASDLAIPEQRSSVQAKILSGYEKPYETLGMHRDGTRLPIEVHAKMFSYKGRQARVAAIRDLSERRKAEEQLDQSEQFVDMVLNSIQDGINVIDHELTIVRTNQTMKKWYSHQLPLEGKKCYEVYMGQSEACKTCPVVRTMNSHKRESAEIKMSLSDDGSRTMELSAFPIFSESGDVRTAVEYVRDITGQKKVENLLKEREQLFRSLFEKNISVILLIDPDTGAILDANPVACEYYGYSRKTLQRMKIMDINVLSKEQIFKEMERAKTEKRNYFNFRHQLADGAIRDVEVFSGPIAVSGKSMLCSIIHDISERKKAEQALADSQRRLADIIEFLPDPTWAIDTQGYVIAWNRAMERFSGIDKSEMIGKGDYAYAVPFYGRPRPVLIDLVLNPDEAVEAEYLSLRKEDGLLYESESFHPILGEGGRYFSGAAGRLYNAQGDVVGAIETIRDITTAKRSEKEREQLIAELREAAAQIRTLSGLLPICSSCKKIRDDKGYWNQIESYISAHSQAEFSHGICPECIKKLYPEFDILRDDKK